MRKIKYAVVLAISVFSVNATASDKYIPALLNFSVLYDFIPVKGKVKELRTHILNDDDGVGYDINISLSPAGCIESFERRGRYPDGEISLSRNGNTLSGTVKGRPLSYTFDEKCNIVSAAGDSGVTDYTTSAEGLMVSATLNGNPLSVHKYNESGRVVRSEYYLHGKVAAFTDISYPIEKERPADAESESTLASGATSSDWNSCTYDQKMVPARCISNARITQNGVRETVIKVADTKVDFY